MAYIRNLWPMLQYRLRRILEIVCIPLAFLFWAWIALSLLGALVIKKLKNLGKPDEQKKENTGR